MADFGYRKLDLDDDVVRRALPEDTGPVRQLILDEDPVAFDKTITEGFYTPDKHTHRKVEAGIGHSGVETACQRARRVFGLDFTYRLDPAQRTRRDGSLETIEGSYWPVRTDTDQVVSRKSVGSKFTLLQPDSLDILDSVLGPNAKYTDGGTIQNGGTVWLNSQLADMQGPNGQTLRQRAFVRNPVDGSGCFEILFHCENLACANQIASLSRNAENRIRIRHTRSAHDKLAIIERAFARSGGMFKTAQAEFLSWGRKTLTNADVENFIHKVFPSKEGEYSTRTQNRIERWYDAYETAPGATPGTVWGLAQASTFLATHEPGRRGNTSLIEAQFLGAGMRFGNDSFSAIREGVEKGFQTVSLV